MTAVWQDPSMTDSQRRQALYRGDLFVYSPTKSSLELVEFARGMIREAFGGVDPERAQYHMPVEDFAALAGRLKPAFIHHPRCKRLLPAILKELGCEPTDTYFDVPRLRTSTSDDYLTTGIAYAFHPHRDTWYSAPMCQINWWMPVFDVLPGNGMAFHPGYFDVAVRNSSATYNYQEWVRSSRFVAANQIGQDTRTQPVPLEPIALTPDIRIVPPPGGIIVFSAAQLHSSVPNQTGRIRFSLDFRTVSAADAAGLRGAANVDSYCTGSTMDDYLSCEDLSHLPASATEPYLDGPPLKPAA